MSEREKRGFLASWLFVAVVCAAAFFLTRDSNERWGMNVGTRHANAVQINTSSQRCALVLNTTGGVINSGTVNVYYTHSGATSGTLDGSATFRSNGSLWCRDLSATANNARTVSVSFISTTASTVPSHIQYDTTGFDETATYVPGNIVQVNGTAQTGGRVYADVTHVTGTAQASGRVNASVQIIANDAITAAAIAASAITSSEAPNLDAAITSRAAASTALTNATWTDARAGYLDRLVSHLDASVTTRAAASSALTNATWTDARAGYLDRLTTHLAGTINAGEHLNSTALNAYLAGLHGTGSWDATAAGSPPPTAEEVADAVWDEDASAHTNGTTMGGKLNAIPTAADNAAAVWGEDLPGPYTTGEAGYILGNILSLFGAQYGTGPWAK